MDVRSFSRQVRRCLLPDSYPGELDASGSTLELILVRPRGRRRLEAFVVAPFDAGLEPRAQLEAARVAVADRAGARWLLREVTLQLMLCGAEADWRPHVGRLRADRTALHSVRVRTVHLADPDTGVSHLVRPAWNRFACDEALVGRLAAVLGGGALR